MRFMMLVKSDARTEAGLLPDADRAAELARYGGELRAAGSLLGAARLRASSLGARVRRVGRRVNVLGGPFCPSEALVAGYWIIEARSKQEAVAWARRAPFRDGEVELRQLLELDDFPVDPGEISDGWRRRGELQNDVVPPLEPGMTRFVTLLRADHRSEAGVLPSEQLLADMGALMAEMVRAGVLLAGEGLTPSSKGVRVRYAGAERCVLDGPFADSAGLIAGFSLIQAKSLGEAVQWSERCLGIHVDGTGIERGEIEIRQLHESDDAR